MRQEMMGFGDAVALAGPYANNLHLAPDMTTLIPHHSVFLVAGCSSWCLTNSVKALKATGAVTGQNVPLASSVSGPSAADSEGRQCHRQTSCCLVLMPGPTEDAAVDMLLLQTAAR